MFLLYNGRMKRMLFLVFAAMFCGGLSLKAAADVSSIGNRPAKLRIRVGDNNQAGVNTIDFQVPGLQLGNATPVVSTTNVFGGSGIYKVRVVLDNRRPPTGTARLTADSSSPLACVTASTCGTTTIPFTKISWSVRDGDNFELASQFNGGVSQLLHQQTVTDSSPPDPRKGWRYRDFVQFKYANDMFLPAGTYRGRVLFKADHP